MSISPPRSSHAVVSRRRVLQAGSAVATASLMGLRPAMSQEASPAVTTRLVETINGPLEVPANPQRVVAIGYIPAIAAAELGVIPIGIPRWVPDLPADFPDLSGATIIENDAWELDIEQIIALEPDLIIGSDVQVEAERTVPYDQLSRIAPTALFPWESGGANWEPQGAGTAAALGKTTEFEALRATYDEHTTSIRETWGDVLATLTVDFVDAGEDEWYLHGPASTHCKVAIDAGVQLGAGADQAETFTGYSFEDLGMLADTGALVVRAGEFSSVDILNSVPTFDTLPAVQAGLVLPSNYFYVSSFTQASALLDELDAGLQLLGEA